MTDLAGLGFDDLTLETSPVLDRRRPYFATLARLKFFNPGVRPTSCFDKSQIVAVYRRPRSAKFGDRPSAVRHRGNGSAYGQTDDPEKAMSQSHIMNGLTPHLFAAGMAAIVVAFPTPSELYFAVFPKNDLAELSFREIAMPSQVTQARFDDPQVSLRGELALCKSTLERGSTKFAPECRDAIIRGQELAAAMADPDPESATAALLSATEIMYCRVVWQQSVQQINGSYDTATCLKDLPQLASNGL